MSSFSPAFLAALASVLAAAAFAADFKVTNDGATSYIINGNPNPDLNLVRGETYNFHVDAAGHPFFIKTVQSDGEDGAFDSGVTNNGAAKGLITFVVPADAPDTLYYICQYHSAMTGLINIVGGNPDEVPPADCSVFTTDIECAQRRGCGWCAYSVAASDPNADPTYMTGCLAGDASGPKSNSGAPAPCCYAWTLLDVAIGRFATNHREDCKRPNDKGCFDLYCADKIALCKANTKCAAAFSCILDAKKSDAGCDDACQTNCQNMANGDSSALQLLNALHSCAKDNCDDKQTSECIPEACKKLRASCAAYSGCNDVVQCISAFNSVAKCDSACIIGCISKVSSSRPPVDLVTEILKCNVDNQLQCNGGDDPDQGSINVDNTCKVKCGPVFATCAANADCIKGLECFYLKSLGFTRRRSIQDNTYCFGLTPSGSVARRALVAAYYCNNDCQGNMNCGQNDGEACQEPIRRGRGLSSSSSDSKPSSGVIQQSLSRNGCAISESCRPIKDSGCSKASSAAACASPCAWDSIRSQCVSAASDCNKLIDQDSCRQNPTCSWSSACISTDCDSQCRKQLYTCLASDVCMTGAACVNSAFEANGEFDPACRDTVVSTGTAADITLFDATYKCFSECIFGNDGTPTPLPVILPDDGGASECPDCKDSIEACSNSNDCHKAIGCVRRQIAAHDLCDSDCVATCSSQANLGDADKTLLAAAVTCVNDNCVKCSNQCNDLLAQCTLDKSCAAGLAVGKARRDANGLCTNDCLTAALAATTQGSSSRELLIKVSACFHKCQSSQTCSAAANTNSCSRITGDKIALNANCRTDARCVLKLDHCADFVNEKDCSADSACEWEWPFCKASFDNCYHSSYNNQADCDGDSACRWSESCRADRSCITHCDDEIQACQQQNSCSSAFNCLQTSSIPNADAVKACAAKYSVSSSTDALAAFNSAAACYTSCKQNSKCDNKCQEANLRCDNDLGCYNFRKCVQESCKKGDTACIYGCLRDNTNQYYRDVSLDLLRCYDECETREQCAGFSTQASCNNQNKNFHCSWSTRCAIGTSQSCTVITNSDECSFTGICAWDDFGNRCIGDATACYTSDDLHVGTATDLYRDQNPSSPAGDASLINFVGVSQKCTAEGCKTENQCIPADRCERKCAHFENTCFKDDGCLVAAICSIECKDDVHCRWSCYPILSSDSYHLFVDYTTCLGGCKLDQCASPTCDEAKAACLDDGDCAYAFFEDFLSLRGTGKCDERCISLTLDDSYLGPDSKDLFTNVITCSALSCDPFFKDHKSCDAINHYRLFSTDVYLLQATCESSVCLAADKAGGVAIDCVWDDVDSSCGCDSGALASNTEASNALCGSSLDACFGCCHDSLSTCKTNSKTFSACKDSYNVCAAACKPLLSDVAVNQGKVDVSSMLTLEIDAGDVDGVDLLNVQQGIYDGLNNPDITVNDIYIISAAITAASRRATSTVSVNYVIRVTADSAADIASAVDSSSDSIGASVGNNIGVVIVSSTSTTLSVTDPSVVAVANANADIASAAGTYIFASEVFTLPAGATLTDVEKANLLTAYIVAYNLPLDTTLTLTIDDVTGKVTISRTVTATVTDADLLPRSLYVCYTDSNSMEVCEYSTTTESATASPSSSNTSTVIGAAVGGGVGLIIILVIVVLLVRRQRKTGPSK